MSTDAKRINRIEELLKGPPTSGDLYAAAKTCERLESLICLGNHPDQDQCPKLKEAIKILRDWGLTTSIVEFDRRNS